MADALLSPAVGGTLWAASAGTIAYCSKQVRDELDEHKVPLMGVLGAFGVVVETLASGISSLPLATFVLFMQPIHLAIGVVEGFVTAAIVAFVYRARPELPEAARLTVTPGQQPLCKLLLAFLGAAVLTGGLLSWFASKDPDGLEWAIAQVSGEAEFKGPENGVHADLAALRGKVAILPDYAFRKAATGSDAPATR